MSNKQVSTGRRSAKRRPPTSRWNFGFGRRLDYAASVALDKFFGHTSHFNTRHTHKRRLEVFMNFCMRHGIQDARTIDQEIIQRFCQYVVARIQGDYQWPEGDTERPISIAYAHNLLSTMNISLWALRGDNRLRVSPRKALGVCRSSVRKKPIVADRLDTQHAASLAIAAGFERGAAVMLLCRAWGMRVREAVMQDLDRMLQEISASGKAAILEGCKGGRSSADRTILVTDFRMEALLFAINVRPVGSKNLLSETDTVRSFLLTEVKPCRLILKNAGIPSFRELRAGFAQDVYEARVGGPSPLKAPIRDRVLDRLGREEVSRQLGHHRYDVASSYIGGVRQ